LPSVIRQSKWHCAISATADHAWLKVRNVGLPFGLRSPPAWLELAETDGNVRK